MSQKTLLVIDDDAPILQLISAIGESCGLATEATSVPKDFLHTLENNSPDLVVLDLVMPKFDGIEVLKRMSDQKTTSRVVLISGADGNLLERASKLAVAWGLDVHASFTKPLDPLLLEKCFREAFPDN